jgi:hypothetical protein
MESVDEETAAEAAAARRDTSAVEEFHPQDSPEDRGFLILASDGESSLRFRGSIRVNGGYDFGGLQQVFKFSPFDIPVGEGNTTEPRFFMQANQSRLGLEAITETHLGQAFMRIEGDFLGDPDHFRLRHAFGSLAFVLAGMTWSTFGDVESLPLTVDLDGPNSSVAERTVQIRYGKSLFAHWKWNLAIEAPTPELSLPENVEPAFQRFPDVITRMRSSRNWGHLQLACVLRSITVRDTTGQLQDLVGYGGLLSGKLNFGSQNGFLFQLVAGQGVSRYITGVTGRGLDAIYNPNTGSYEVVGSRGGFVSIMHRWSQKTVSYLTTGLIQLESLEFQPPDAFSLSRYLSANVFWDVTPGVRQGLEFNWGLRQNNNGEQGRASRLSFIIYYDF